MNNKTDKSVNTLLTSIQFLHPWHIIAVEYSGTKKKAQAVAEFLQPMYFQVACPGPFAIADISCPG